MLAVVKDQGERNCCKVRSKEVQEKRTIRKVVAQGHKLVQLHNGIDLGTLRKENFHPSICRGAIVSVGVSGRLVFQSGGFVPNACLNRRSSRTLEADGNGGGVTRPMNEYLAEEQHKGD